ncbi:MAG TPA: uracil-DNA glycosylase family protein, partial [Clostridia bacterium]|nr:uracil-DNA glycosylase family protein [Clostridia bacterium]
ELHIINPSIIVSLGNTALRAISGDNSLTIGNTHGVPIKVDVGEDKISTILFPLYHPASIIYRRELKEVYIEDLHKLRNYLLSP